MQGMEAEEDKEGTSGGSWPRCQRPQQEEGVCGGGGLGRELELRLGEEGICVGMIQCRAAEPGGARKVSVLGE